MKKYNYYHNLYDRYSIECLKTNNMVCTIYKICLINILLQFNYGGHKKNMKTDTAIFG